MLVFITKPQEAMCSWLAERVGLVPTRNIVCFGNYDTHNKRLAGVVGYDQWTTSSVEMIVAGEENWLNREMLYKAFRYPFELANLNTVVCRISADNDPSLRFNLKLGFKELCRIPKAADGGYDLIITAMQRHECRWLGPPHQLKRAA